MRDAFDAGVCLDLGAFDPQRADAGVADWLARALRAPSWVVVMEDRQPEFFHGYRGYAPADPAPLNRHGPRQDAWTQADLKRLVQAFQRQGVRVLLGYWAHECPFVDERHPELLIRDADGALWQDTREVNADFSPLRRMRADAEADVQEGERYASWSARQYARIQRDFGFDGLFLGDGAMGFRRHGIDWKDLRHFDYHADWLAEFVEDADFLGHEGCALHDPEADTRTKADDVHVYHWPHWVAWNTARWTDYYRTMAEAVHDTGGMLAAYNCMNYDPSLARLHGVDYRAIAEAGLDVLVFQAYDYAWGPRGPFGELHIEKKDIATNFLSLQRIRAHVGHDTGMRIVVTVETEDEVETWDAPVAHTLGEAHAYGDALSWDGEAWRRAADGAFVVWGNSVGHEEWRQLAACFSRLSDAPAPPAAALVWEPGEERTLSARGAPRERDPDALYAHLDVLPTVGEGAATGIVRASQARDARLAAPHLQAGDREGASRAPARARAAARDPRRR